MEIPVPDPNKHTSPDELGRFLSRFHLDRSLLEIGTLSFGIANGDKPFIKLDDVPVDLGILTYLAGKLTEYSDNNRCKPSINMEWLKEAIQLWATMPEKITNKREAHEALLRQHQAHYQYNEAAQYHLARSYAIFCHYWLRNDQCKITDIDALYKSITSFSIKEAMLFGQIFATMYPAAFVRYRKPAEGFRNRLVEHGVDLTKQKEFFEWFSSTPEGYRLLLEKQPPPTEWLDKYRFNPLWSSPFISAENGQFIMPNPKLAAYAVTRGIFHVLGDRTHNPRSGDFRSMFGHAFEDYVYDVIEHSQWRRDTTLREMDYGGGTGITLPTSDVSVIEQGTGVLIEAKHSSLSLPSLLYGNLDEVKLALKNNISAGIVQLSRFKYHLDNDPRTGVLSPYSKIVNFEHLIVTHDNLAHLNGLLRDLAMEVVQETLNIENKNSQDKIVSTDFYVHVMSVQELEWIAELNISLYAFLRMKRLDPKMSREDFDIYAESIHGGDLSHSRFLGAFFNEFMAGYGKSQ